jgi:hypothetical protein
MARAAVQLGHRDNFTIYDGRLDYVVSVTFNKKMN